MITFDYSDLEYHNEGSYGHYFKIKGTNRGFKGIKANQCWRITPEQEASKEYNMLCEVAKITRMAPRPYGLARVKDPKTLQWIYGYVMEHIDGKHDADYKALKYVKNRLKKLNIDHGDLHHRNVIVSKRKNRNRYRVIDFACVTISK